MSEMDSASSITPKTTPILSKSAKHCVLSAFPSGRYSARSSNHSGDDTGKWDHVAQQKNMSRTEGILLLNIHTNDIEMQVHCINHVNNFKIGSKFIKIGPLELKYGHFWFKRPFWILKMSEMDSASSITPKTTPILSKSAKQLLKYWPYRWIW